MLEDFMSKIITNYREIIIFLFIISARDLISETTKAIKQPKKVATVY